MKKDDLYEAYRRGFQDGWDKAQSLLTTHTSAYPAAIFDPPPKSWPTKIGPHAADWIRLYHTGNGGNDDLPPACHKVGLYLTRRLKWGERGNTDLLRLVNGKKPEPGDRPVCGECFEPVDPYSQAYFDYSDAWEEGHGPPPPPEKPVKPDPVDEITQALALLEKQVTDSSKPPDPLRVCLNCGEAVHTGFMCETHS